MPDPIPLASIPPVNHTAPLNPASHHARVTAARALAERLHPDDLPPPPSKSYDTTRAERLAWYAARASREALRGLNAAAGVCWLWGWFAYRSAGTTPHAHAAAIALCLTAAVLFRPPPQRPRVSRMLSARAARIGDAVMVLRLFGYVVAVVGTLAAGAHVVTRTYLAMGILPWIFATHHARLAAMAIATHYDPITVPEGVVHVIARTMHDGTDPGLAGQLDTTPRDFHAPADAARKG